MKPSEEVILISIEEIEEAVSNINTELPSLETDGVEDAELINRIFRYIHSVKGLAGMLELDSLKELCQRLENLLDNMRGNAVAVTENSVDILFQGADLFQEIITCYKKQRKEPKTKKIETSLQNIYARIEQAEHAHDPKSAGEAETDKIIEEQTKTNFSTAVDNTIRIETDKLDFIMNRANEIIVNAVQLEDNFHKIKKMVEHLEELRNSLKDNGDTTSSDELYEEIDKVHNFFLDQTTNLRKAIDAVTSSSSQLSEGIIKARMVPMNRIFSQFPRMVRDLAKQHNKKVAFELDCDEMEMDKQIVEMIYSPVVHMLRNAVDHGMETEEERLQAGKAGKGTIRIAAACQGPFLTLQISDDGRGMDPDKIAAKAVEKGLISQEKVDTLKPAQKVDLVCLPGFSTRDEVSDTSGRGVGMDVVKTNIEKMNGTLEIESTPGQGTTISIMVPTNLAMLMGFLYDEGAPPQP